MTVHKKLLEVQKDLHVPKNQTNKFGGYKYRSLEDIQTALKPLNEAQGLSLTLSDEIKYYGAPGGEVYQVDSKGGSAFISFGHFYIEATATLTDIETGDFIQVKAQAREAEYKKGMDPAQCSGATSSYARKYALNGLYAIDDTADADTDGYHQQTNQQQAPVTQPTADQKAAAVDLGKLKDTGIVSDEDLKALQDKYKARDYEGFMVGYTALKATLDKES